MTEIGDLIFDNNSTLFEVLDTLDVPNIAGQLDAANVRLDEVNDQLRQLGVIVDQNQFATTTAFIAVNTRLDSQESQISGVVTSNTELQSRINGLNDTVNIFAEKVVELNIHVVALQTTVGAQAVELAAQSSQIVGLTASNSALTTQVATLSTQVSEMETQVNSLQREVMFLTNDRFNNDLLVRGNEYIFNWRVGTNTYSRRTTFTGANTEGIFANTGYAAIVLDSQTGSFTNQTVYLCASFDNFRVNGIVHYAITAGTVQYSYSPTGLNALTGYITHIS